MTSITFLLFQRVPRELYGPTMIVFTLIAILLYQMKTSGHTVVSFTLSIFIFLSLLKHIPRQGLNYLHAF